ncbi:MAG: nitroreductase family deazaflavin-dependent oxidoreductase [Caldilineaceae bacterium]|nr:nitroreductase family deazaflavin-dependent oxidoreductase [Caldilineaceae bacterium]
MPTIHGATRFILRLIHFPPRLLYAVGLGPLIGQLVLLLTTTGRRTGRTRVTPLQYEEIDGTLYVAAARGPKADWFRNLMADPNVEVQIKARRFRGKAVPIRDPQQIADFLETRLQRHPKMVGAILRAEGLPVPPNRGQLERYAAKLALVALKEADEL